MNELEFKPSDREMNWSPLAQARLDANSTLVRSFSSLSTLKHKLDSVSGE